MERVVQLNKKYERNLGLKQPFVIREEEKHKKKEKYRVTQYYDVLSLASIENVTKA